MQKTPSLQFSVMCLDLLEEEQRPPTLQYLFYELPFPQLPFRMDKFHVINAWANGSGNFSQSVKILDPTRTKTFVETGEQTFSLEDTYTPQLMINVFAELEFQEEGHYWVQNYLNNQLVLEYPLTIRLLEGGKVQPQKPDQQAAQQPVQPQKPSAQKPTPSSGPTFIDEWNIPQ
ncbi:MAG: hypothetical protein M1169_00810 [Firmicutes bacterium]|nr:hypothetical protein [Bacillota bacterium]